MGILTLSLPAQMVAAEMEFAALEQVDEQISIIVSASAVTISGAQGKQLQVVSLTGNIVMDTIIDSPSQRVELNIPKGCYILKVGKVVRKITVR